VIGEVAQVEPVRDSQTLTVVKCSSTFSCGVARLLVPASQLTTRRQIMLDNQTRVAVEVDRTVTEIRGTKTGQALNAQALEFDLPRTLTADSAEWVDLTIRTDGVSSDVYQGSVRFRIANSRDSVPVTLTLNVRDGPMLAILVVFIGIGVGRLAKKMQSPAAQMQVKLFTGLRSRRDEAARIQDQAALAAKQPSLACTAL
jgi:hypothetical protein